RDGNDPWIRSAILSSATSQPAAIIAAVVSDEADPSVRAGMMKPLVASALGARAATSVHELLDSLPKPRPGSPIPPWWFALAVEIVERKARDEAPLPSSPFRNELFARARVAALDETRSPADRMDPIRLLGHEEASRAEDVGRLAGLLEPRNPGPVQR